MFDYRNIWPWTGILREYTNLETQIRAGMYLHCANIGIRKRCQALIGIQRNTVTGNRLIETKKGESNRCKI
jgi:hypothetical protein